MTSPVLRSDAVIPVGAVAAAVLAFRYRGVLHATVIVKTSFGFVRDAPMRRTAPQEIVRAEVHHGHSPARSVRLTTDLVPYLNHADVLFTGHAHAPGGNAVPVMRARLSIFDGAQAVIDKSLLVRDDGGFVTLPLVYERAYGGPGVRDNPLGVCAESGTGEPGIVDPEDETRAVGFAPLGQDWPARRARLGSLSRRALAAPIVELPDDVDWEYFQAAPPDQRMEFLRGDEWIVLEGLSPTVRRLCTRLPGALGLGRVYGLSPWGIVEGQPLEMHADILRIDGDEERATLTFRGTFPIDAGDEALGALRVMAGVELPGDPIVWPDLSGKAVDESLGEGTINLLDEDLESVPRETFEGTMTVGMSDTDVIASRRATVPFLPAPPPPLSTPGSVPGYAPWSAPSSEPAHGPAPSDLDFDTVTEPRYPGVAITTGDASVPHVPALAVPALDEDEPLLRTMRFDSEVTVDTHEPLGRDLPFQPGTSPLARPDVAAPRRSPAVGPGGTVVHKLDTDAVARLRALPLRRGPARTMEHTLDEQDIAALRNPLPFVTPIVAPTPVAAPPPEPPARVALPEPPAFVAPVAPPPFLGPLATPPGAPLDPPTDPLPAAEPPRAPEPPAPAPPRAAEPPRAAPAPRAPDPPRVVVPPPARRRAPAPPAPAGPPPGPGIDVRKGVYGRFPGKG